MNTFNNVKIIYRFLPRTPANIYDGALCDERFNGFRKLDIHISNENRKM